MQQIKIALIGAGMFGADVHLRAFADAQRAGIAGVLGRLGFDEFARPLAEVRFQLVAVATRSQGSAGRAADAYARWMGSGARPQTYHGERPWEAVLEEPLEVSTSTFKWAEQSDPFSYVGPHWTDLFHHYYGAKPIGLTAVGQKVRLRREGIDAYDAVQVRVDWDNGMSIYFQNNWITPADFEGPVNQEHEIVGADGKVESDQQYRGLRFWWQGGGSRTSNSHFTRDVPRADGSAAYIGYGTDSIYAGLLAACRIKFLGATLADVQETFPTPESGRITVAIVHAARIVRDRNFAYQEAGRAPAVSAAFGPDGIAILDPHRAAEGPEAVCERIYDRPI